MVATQSFPDGCGERGVWQVVGILTRLGYMAFQVMSYVIVTRGRMSGWIRGGPLVGEDDARLT